MNDTKPSPQSPIQQLDLGPEVVHCRRLSGPQTLRAQGFAFGWLAYYVLFPLFGLTTIALVSMIMPFLALGYSVETIPGPAAGIGFALVYLLVFWLVFLVPRADHFVLHEKGIRIRLGFKRMQSPLEAVQGIFVGRAPSKIERGLMKVVGVLKPSQATWFSELAGTALTVVMKDGTTHVFKTLLTCFEPLDLEKLSQELVQRNPRFGANDPDSGGTNVEPEKSPEPTGWRFSWKSLGWVFFLLGLVLAIVWFSGIFRSGARPVEEKFDVAPRTPKLIPVGVKKGDFLHLSVSVTSGSPVDVHVGREAVSSGKSVFIKGSGLFEAKQIRNFRRQEEWPFPTPAIIVVNSTGRSKGLLKVEVLRAP
jgi:hypothetical protein